MTPQPAPGAVDVDAVAAAVAGCPSVAHLVQGGPGDQIATFLPGRRVGGVRVSDDAVEVHIATRWDVPIPAAAAEVRSALATLARGRSVTVAVDDIDDPRAALPVATPDGPPLALGSVPATPSAVPDPRPMPSAGGGGADLPAGAGRPGEPPDPVPSPS